MLNDSGSDNVDMVDVTSDKIIGYLNYLLNKPVLLPIPLGEKGPKRKGWNKTTYEMTQSVGYQREIELVVKSTGNLGILLGPPSGNLVTIDLDSDEEMEKFLEFAPWARNTLRSIGAKGCQCWFYIVGKYPNKRVVWKTAAGKPTVEFRGDLQSVIWGTHPTGTRYKTNGKEPMHIPYLDLQEYSVLLREETGDTVDEDTWRAGQQGDFKWTKKYKGCDLKELDLVGLLKEAGIRYKKIDAEEEIERYAMQCPWVDEHQSENSDRDAAVFMFEPRGKYWPAFVCFHAHCADRHLKDLLEWLEREHAVRPSTVRKHCGGPRQRIEILDRTDLIDAPTLPEPIIDGLLYPELKMLIASASKIGKTWLGIDLALSLAGGTMWMDFNTVLSRVLYLNLEMPRLWFDLRICKIKEVRGIRSLPPESFKVANLRGSNALVDNLVDPLLEVCEKHGPFDVIIYDPIYKLLGDRDENSARDVADLLGMIDEVGKITGAASIPIHHYAKGDAWQKKAGDRASGSGVFLRDPDTYMAITEIGEESSGTARVDCRLRCSRPISSFGIRWDNYQWKRDPTVDIGPKSKKKDSESGPKQPTKSEQMLQILRDNPAGLTYAMWKKMVLLRNIVPNGNAFDAAVNRMRSQTRFRQEGDLYFAV